MKRALFRPSSFFRGLLVPFCKSEVTMRQAQIMGYIILQTRLPTHHLSAGLMMMLDLPFKKQILVILKFMIDKKSNLHSLVLNRIVGWFLGFTDFPVK